MTKPGRRATSGVRGAMQERTEPFVRTTLAAKNGVGSGTFEYLD
ncbi:MAG TPA: hypothetical protein VIL87_05750 [Dermatophilaceae bacterium]|jgi:hypothetical protein